MVGTGTVVVCEGSTCRKSGEQRRLCRALTEAGLVVLPSPCLGVCAGPVLAGAIRDRVEVVSNIRDPDDRDRVVSALGGGKRKKVKRLLVKGGRRERALRKAAKALARAS